MKTVLIARHTERKTMPSKDAIEQAVEALISYTEQQECVHDETYRGGAIWEICSQCGSKWADDEGGKPEYIEPEVIIRAKQALTALQGAKPVDVLPYILTTLAMHPESTKEDAFCCAERDGRNVGLGLIGLIYRLAAQGYLQTPEPIPGLDEALHGMSNMWFSELEHKHFDPVIAAAKKYAELTRGTKDE